MKIQRKFKISYDYTMFCSSNRRPARPHPLHHHGHVTARRPAPAAIGGGYAPGSRAVTLRAEPIFT